jgi:single-strand DNA-binding protein
LSFNKNRVFFAGNLGHDPDLNYLPDGTAVCNFSLASNETWKDKASGEKKQRTTWMDVAVYGAQAEACKQYLGKGCNAHVEGSIQVRETEKDGSKRKFYAIKADRVDFITFKDEKKEDGAETQPQAATPTTTTRVESEDDLPF